MNQAPENDPRAWARLSSSAREMRRAAIWLARSVSWQGISPRWKPIKVLGQGSYGICGLFENQEPDPNTPRHIVVKQSGNQDESLKIESRLLARLGAAGSRHVVKMYKSYHQEPGTGTSEDFDPLPFMNIMGTMPLYSPAKEVSRIYLEYCQKGDMLKFLKYIDDSNGQVSELAAWKILECLARAAMVLEEGTEDPNVEVAHEQVAHFDIKPQNILISANDADHTSGVFKLADFGLSRTVPNPQTQGWIFYSHWRFTTGWGPPEQLCRTHHNPYIGTPCNIWGIAACMYALLTHGRLVPQEIFTLHFHDPPERPPIVTMGYSLLSAELAPFSRFLKEMILSCLAWDPSDRPRARNLVDACKFAIRTIGTEPFEPPPSSYYFFEGSLLELPSEERAQPGGFFAGERHVGDTPFGAGPHINHLNFPPGIHPDDRDDWRSVWDELPPSPGQEPAGRGAHAGPSRIPSNDDGGVRLGTGFDQQPAQGMPTSPDYSASPSGGPGQPPSRGDFTLASGFGQAPGGRKRRASDDIGVPARRQRGSTVENTPRVGAFGQPPLVGGQGTASTQETQEPTDDEIEVTPPSRWAMRNRGRLWAPVSPYGEDEPPEDEDEQPEA